MTSKHADLLNALDQMQQSPAYAVRRQVLAQAERVIPEQEETIAALEHENSLLRDLARKHEVDRDAAEFYERLLTEIGKSIRCGHLDERLPSCVEEAVGLQDELAVALKAARRAMQNDWHNKPRIGMENECAQADAVLAKVTKP